MLNLPKLKQTKLVETDEQYEVHATADCPVPDCGCLLPQIVRNGTKPVLFMDTPIHGKKVGIVVARQRYLCQNCRKTIYPDVPHMHTKHDMTERLVAYIERHGTERTFTALANELGIDSQTVSGIWNAEARRKMDALGPVTPEWLGIDELFIMKAYRAVITNIKEHTLVDMLPNRKKVTVVSYLANVMEPEKIKAVTMDMWDDYRQAVKMTLPHAIIVADRFHIMQHASSAVESVRKQLRASLNFKKRIGLIGDRWLFRTAREKLDAGQTLVLEAVLEQYPLIKEAYTLKEAFRDVWKETKRDAAEAHYAEWLKRVEASQVVEAYRPLTTALVNWHEEAFNYLDLRITNAYAEAFNSLARRMDRNGRGYSFPVLRAKLLMMYSCHKMGKPVPFKRSRPVVVSDAPPMMGFGMALPSTCEEEVILQPGRFLGLDLSTLADEVAKWPKN